MLYFYMLKKKCLIMHHIHGLNFIAHMKVYTKALLSLTACMHQSNFLALEDTSGTTPYLSRFSQLPLPLSYKCRNRTTGKGHYQQGVVAEPGGNMDGTTSSTSHHFVSYNRN